MTTSDQNTELETPAEGLPMTQGRKWDWRVIALELMVVFVGLFGALQLDNYRDGQQFKAQQDRYLQRLAQDLNDYLADNASMMTFLELNMRATAQVAASLKAGEILLDDRELFDHGLIYYGHLPSINLPRATYDEMVAAGMFSALESEALKSAVSSLFSFHEQTERNFTWWREHVARLTDVLSPEVEYGHTDQSSAMEVFNTTEPERTVRYEFEGLAENRDIRNRFYWAADTSKDWYQMTSLVRQSAEGVLELIRAELQQETR